MCGITGFVGKGDKLDLQRMTTSLTHRGPDSEGSYIDLKNHIFMGVRRLAVIDKIGGSQPIWTQDRKVGIVFNGEIYNFQEIKNHLLKNFQYTFQTSSDTEVLLAGYLKWGQNLVEKLNGMWSFAIYDKRKNIIFISRDRFGEKPLFYTRQKNLFAFSSELSSLIKHSQIGRKLSQPSLIKYFAYGYIPSPLSLYENIYKLPAGSVLVYHLKSDKLIIKKYWSFHLDPAHHIPPPSILECEHEIRRLLDLSVQRRLTSDVPLGIYLSGGIDSSSIAYFAKKYKPDLKTFSIGFTEKSFDETKYSQKVSDFLKTRHYHHSFSLAKAYQVLPEIFHLLDEPLADSSIIPAFFLNKFAKKYITTALGGDGADELFGGYAPFQALKASSLYHKLTPSYLHNIISHLASHFPSTDSYMNLSFKLKKTLSALNLQPQYWLPVWLSPLPPNDIENLFGVNLDLHSLYQESDKVWHESKSDDLIDQTLLFFTRLYLENDILVKSDRASMMNSVELRSPYLDIELVNFIKTIPPQYKVKGFTTKYIFKKSMDSFLPHDIIYKKKQGFAVPVSKWFRENKLKIDSNKFSFLNTRLIDQKIQDHQKFKADNHLFLWSLFMLQNFLYRETR